MWKKALDWIFVTDALRVARARFRQDETVRGPLLQQARLLGEIAGRIAEPAEPLPLGDRKPVIVRLLRDGVALALTTTPPAVETAGQRNASDAIAGIPEAPSPTTPPALEKVWDATPEAVLREAVEDPAQLPVVKATLLDPAAAPLDDEALKQTRTFLDRLLWNAEAPRRRVEALLIQRALRVTAVVIVLCLLGVGVRLATHGKNLLQGKPFSVSSSWPGCVSDPSCDGVLLFHTNNENEPWVIFDLQVPTKVHEIEVTNRQDSYQERAIPLVAEMSTDHQHWREVGRRTEPFTTWTVTFPATTARYIRLKVARVSTLHLKSVEAR